MTDINNLESQKYVIVNGLVCWNVDMQVDSGLDVTAKDVNDLKPDVFPEPKIRTVT